ncbi:MAG: hypothetical protein KF706_09265 [Chitinophagales bacterium]|nr:hypothetical protein [Chitinophagales bacterium]
MQEIKYSVRYFLGCPVLYVLCHWFAYFATNDRKKATSSFKFLIADS